MSGNKISRVLLASTALSCLPLIGMPAPALAGPQDGVVSGGAATITQSGLNTAIHQSTDRAIIDWRSFDVDAGESLRFFQPGTSSLTLNRIHDSKASQINGLIEANGQIMLLNQNGIVFGAGSRVDVAGLIASTSDIDNQAFMSGSSILNLTPGSRADAQIINHGHITARDAGLVGLVAPTVENYGIIEARLGKVTLAGAERVTLDLAGDQLISIDVTDQIEGHVKNSGLIAADGGTITLTASRASQAVETSIINTGTLRANSVGVRNGRIILSAGGYYANKPKPAAAPTPAVVNAGTILATGQNAGETGGQIEILGDSVSLTEDSLIDTSGMDGGGIINIGGSYQGAADRPTAAWVEVAHGSTTRSNGGASGDGGTIIFWADRLMTFRGFAEAEGGDDSGDGGFVEVSGKNRLIYDGHVSTLAAHGKTGMLLLDPTNIEITNAASQNVTGASPYTPDADDVVSILDAATLLAALSSSSVIVQTRATGLQAGDITVNAALTWASGNTLTLDAHHDIIVNQAISGANIHLVSGNDVQLNANLTGSGILTIEQKLGSTTMGVGAASGGTLNLSTTDLSHIIDGWSKIVLGNATSASTMTVTARTWTDALELRSGTGVITISGAQTMGANNLTITSDADLVLSAALTGTGALSISGQSTGTSMGLGAGATGTLNLTAAEIANITNGWTDLIFGRTDSTAALNVQALTWNDNLTLQDGSGGININGVQTMGANNLTMVSGADIALGAAVTGTGNLNISGVSASTTIGLGNASGGTINLDATELSRITNGWSQITIGRADSTAALTLTSTSWNDHLLLKTGSGVISINGALAMSSNNLSIFTDGDLTIGAALSGTGILTIGQTGAATVMGLGTGQTGSLNLTDAEIVFIADGWSRLVFGSGGALNTGAASWNDAVTLQSGAGIISINGIQTMGANALAINTDSDLAIGAGLTGSGTLTISGFSAATTMGLGTGQTGALQLSNADLANITNGWANLIFGRTDGSGAINVGATSWNDNLTLQSNTGVISINGIQTMAANNLTINTDADLAIGAGLTGSGTLTIGGLSAATIMGIGTGQTGALQLSNADLANITDGWTRLVFGSSGALNVGAASWNDAVTLQSIAGVISINGAQTMGANALTISTDADLAIGAALTGSGTLTIAGYLIPTTMGIGTGQAGALQLSNADIANITDGWANLVFGRTDGTGAVNVGALTWNDAVTFQSETGVLTIAGIQTMGANALTLNTNSNIALNAALTGTGTLTIRQAAANTTMGLGAAATGTVNLDATELARITNGWANLIFGRTDGTGAINVTALTWNDNLTLQSASGVITIAGIQTMGANNLNITTDADLVLNAALTGTGALTIAGQSAATTIGLGNAATGTLNLTATEIGRITNGWTDLFFGRAGGTGAINVTANTWNDQLNLISDTGVISFTGAQAFGGNNLLITTNADLSIVGTLTSAAGTLTISGLAAGTTMGLGTGQVGTLNLTDTELSNIANGWANLIFGTTTSSGAMNVGALSWNDHLTLKSGNGIININGAQNLTGNNLTISSDADLNVGAALTSAGGTLTITQQDNATTMGVGNGQTGALNLNDTEISRITDGWANIILGSSTATGTMNVGAATWLDALTLRSATGLININGIQTMGANALTINTDADLAINAGLTGSGTLAIAGQSAATVMGIGTGQTGTLQLNNADLANITDGWTNLVFGSGGAINAGAVSWNDAVTLQSGAGVISINGTQTMGANALTIRSDADLAIGAGLTGSGTLTIAGFTASTIVGIGTGQTGTLQLSNADIANITNGWASLVLGRTDGTGAVNVGALTWNDDLTLQADTGILTIAGIQTMGSSALTLSTNSNIALNAALTGTGTLTVKATSAGTTMGLGNAATGTVNLDATEIGRITNGWANLIFGRADGTGAMAVTANTWNDFLTLQSSTGVISISGTQTMGTNTLNITTDADIALTGALTGSTTLTISGQSAGTTIGLGAAATGTINLTATEIGLITNGWTNLIFGRTDGTGAINTTAVTWNDYLTLRTATGIITIGGIQTMAANNNLTIQTDADLVLNAALTGSGTGTLTISGQSAATTIGLGNAATGTLNLTATEVGRITNGWANLFFGRTDSTGAINVTANTWNDHLNLTTDTGAISISGAQAISGNNLTITTNTDVSITAALTSTAGTLTISGQTAATTLGLGTGQIGTINLSDTEIANITNGWTSLVFGMPIGSGNINVGALSWNDHVTLRSGSGIININGTQSLNGNNLTITSDTDVNLAPGALLSSAGGALSISQQSNATTMGIGTGQTGTINLTDTELGQISDGWASITLGSATATGTMNVGAYTWLDALTLRSAAGVININGAQNMGANNLTITSNANPLIGAALTGTGTLNLTTTTAATTIGIGDSQTGTFNLTNAELDYIGSTWTRIVIGNIAGTGIMNVGAYTWNDAVTLQSTTGVININGNQTMGANELAISTDANLNLVGQLIGSGLLNIYATTTGTIGVGTGQTGTLALTDAEVSNIANGWNMILFGRAAQTGVINAGTRSWNDNLTYSTNTGIITINGNQTMLDTNTLTFSTNANLALNANLTGASTLSFQGAAIGTTIGIGTGQAGTLSLDNLELGRIQSGWNELVFGSSAQSGATTLGAYTWQYNTRFISDIGVITVAGAQTVNDKNMTFETNGNLTVSAALGGTGILTIKGASSATAMGIGNSQAGALALVDTELALIQDGWSQIIFGRNDMSSQMNVGARTWTDNVKFTTGSGQLRINAAQTMGANNLTLETDSDLLLSGNLNGSGILTIQGASIGTSIGVGTGQTGALSLIASDLTRIVDGWSQVQFGRNDMTGAINIGANNWLNKMTFLTRGNIVINGNQTTTETSGNTMVFATLAGAFINNGTATSINPGTGRFLVYSVNAANDTYNSMARPTILTQKSYYGYSPGSVTESGNVFIYSDGAPKVIQVKIDNITKVYGDTVPILTWTYIGGLEGTDALTTAITASTLTATGAAATDSVGVTRTITGMFTTGGGYSVSITDGTLSVTKAPIVIQSTAATRIYGDANPTLTATYTGFKNGDTIAVIDTQAVLSTTATIASNVATYAITGAGAIDNNYIFNYNSALLTITKANLSITADNKTREYGDANPALTVTYSGFKNGDTSAVIDTNPTLATAAIATTAVGTPAITLTGGTDNNYNLVLTNGTLTITKATLTATADNKTREYGDANPAFTTTYTGFKNSETTAAISTLATGSTAAITTTGIGNYTITSAGAIATNYNFTYVDGSLAITKATLTATADNKTRIYGDANPALTVSYTGFKNGETTGILNSLATASTTASATTGVGNQVISVSGATANNYNIVHTNGTLAITKAMLTVIAGNKTREYGDANPALTLTYTGFKNGEDDTVLTTASTVSTAATATTGAGNHVITASGGTANNYDFTYTNGTLAITKATLTATADNKTRAYGDANPALTTSYTGFKNSDTSGVIDTAATAATIANGTSGVGNHVITTSGAIDDNYNFVYANGTLAITKATITATADNKTREFGDANPTLTVSYTGFKNGENSGVFTTAATASTTAIATTGAGNVAITASGATDDNYDFVYNNGVLTITKATITVTADNKTREYGDANPVLTVSYAGFKNTDNSSVFTTGATAATTATLTTGVGNEAITASGATANNYDFVYNNGILAITKATITVTADNKTREFGDANPALTVGYTGFKNGENSGVFTTGATAATTATTTTGVGNVAITASGATDDNYSFVYNNGVLAITKATITVTADNKTREYGDANPALTVSYAGFKNTDNSSVFTTGATASTAATGTTGVGNVAITAAGATDDNYDFVYNSGTLAITKATLTATAGNKTREYGDANPALTISYTGFKNGENSGVINSAATASTTATTTTGAGNEVITASGAADDNYDFIYNNGILAITKATITVTADNKTREYGDANPALTVSYAGFKNTDNSSVFTTGATAATTATVTTGVGNAAITASGATDDNYDFVYTNGTLAITKATLTATADNQTREYGDANPALTTTYTGFKNGENSGVINTAATTSTTATSTTGVGSYTITTSGAADDNYDFVYNNGTLAITKATITATADNKTREYGDANPALTTSYTGFKNGETSSVFTTAATTTTTATAATGAGNEVITTSGATDDNYDFVYNNGILAITKATITVTADNKTREYGDANPALTLSYAGFKNTDNSSVFTTDATAATTATATTGVGNVAITASGATDDNYDFVYNNGILAITKATITVTADNKTREYGDTNPALTVSYAGFKNADNSGVFTTGATVSTTATATTGVGNRVITASGATDDNYDFVYNSGTLAITKATLTATADNKTREYGDANPTLTTSYTGFKNGETSGVIDTAATATTTATATTGVSNQVISTSGALDDNYDFIYTNGTLAITKATVTVTADNKTREYGDANPALSVSYTGLKNGENSGVFTTGATASTTATATTGVGNRVITASGATDDNYDFTYNNGTLAITKATLTVTANNATKIYGDANPALSVSYSGFKNGETNAVLNTAATASTTASTSSNVGNVAITAGGGADDNYAFAYVGGTLAITKAALTATINNITREYGLSNPTFTISYAGFKNGNTASVLDTTPNPTTTATSGSGIGNYAITAAPVTDNNYSVTFVSGNLQVTRATLNVEIYDQIRLQGDANPALTYNLNGLRNGDTGSVISGLVISTPANPASPLGNYAITGAGATAANYSFTYSPGVLQVLEALPVPVPPSTGLIPGGVSYSLSAPQDGMGIYNPLYNLEHEQVFLSGSIYGDETPQGNYIALYYHTNPMNFEMGTPLMLIDPNLYIRHLEDELKLSRSGG